ncbi:MAG: ABC transporter permease [Planctomycetota bacterium]
MKSVDVKRQHRPPLRRCMELVLSGVKYRLFRAAITVGIIALAVAFLMTMLTESVVTRRVAKALEAQVAPRKLLQAWVARLSEPPDRADLGSTLATMQPGGPRWKEFARWGDLSDDQLRRLQEVARRQQQYLDFFMGLDHADRRRALGEAEQRHPRMFKALINREAGTAEQVQLNAEAFATMQDVLEEAGESLPTSAEAFKQFLRDWWATRPLRDRILAGHEKAIAALNRPGRLLHEREPLEVLSATGVDELRRILSAEDVGFHVSRDELNTVQREARYAHDAQKIEATLGSPLLKARLAKRRNLGIHQVNARVLLEEVSSLGGAEWLVELTGKARGLTGLTLSAERIRQAALTETEESVSNRMFALWVKRLTEPLKPEDVAKAFASGQLPPSRRREFAAWGELSEAEISMLMRLTDRARGYREFMKELTPEQHLDNYAAFAADDPVAALRESLRTQGITLPLPGWMDAHARFAHDWLGAPTPQRAAYVLFGQYVANRRRARALYARIAEGHAQALAALNGEADGDDALLAHTSAEALLENADAEVQSRLAAVGFVMPDRQLRLIQEHTELRRTADRLRKLAESPLLREELLARSGKSLDEIQKQTAEQGTSPTQVVVEMLMDQATDPKGAAWLDDLLGRVASLKPLDMPAERIKQVAERQLAKRDLAETEAAVATITAETGFMGFSTRALWLLMVSFLVCVVGIANAMLMSVTERFREIATMKCLGATDGFIMINFVLESCLQGVAGSAMGLALGVVLGILRTAVQYGAIAFQQLPGFDLLGAAGFSIVVGIVISALAAVYPAWVAARLAPMEAMRIE